MHSSQMLDYALMQQNSCPFNLSKLKFLSIGWRTHVPWPHFSPAVQSIEGLDIVVNASAASLVLSAFPAITFLRISLPSWIHHERTLAMLDRLFSSLGPTNTLQKIVIFPSNAAVQMDGVLCTTLDAKLSSAPMPPTLVVELEVERNFYEGIWPFFLSLSGRNSKSVGVLTRLFHFGLVNTASVARQSHVTDSGLSELSDELARAEKRVSWL
ncbi:hypothetical protein C8R45DRAFT_928262 [Mycena sanguinolenta]|nr:hypothetical protein C8R45DRAFT_928262 [Mycena sanguinolenta]